MFVRIAVVVAITTATVIALAVHISNVVDDLANMVNGDMYNY